MKIEQTLKQRGIMSPQMIQSMELLRMNTAELEEYLQQLAMENPVMELEPPKRETAEGRREAEEFCSRLRWLEDNDRQNLFYHRGDAEEDTADPLATATGRSGLEQDLYTYLAEQLRQGGGDIRAAKYIAACLDDRGWLPAPLGELAAESGIEEAELAAGLERVRSLDPAGVGATDLGDCLALQLERMGETGCACELARRFLDRLSRRSWRALSNELGVPEAEVKRAAELISRLDPHPCEGYKRQDAPVYVVPDVIVSVSGGELSVSVNSGALPRLRASQYYMRMMESGQDAEVAAYLEEKLRQFKNTAKAVAQRGSTLLACAESIARRQSEFFLGGTARLRPMTQADVAADLGVHASTVGRAVRDKYLGCRQGVFPMSYFFSCAVGEVGSRGACELLRELIEGEDKLRPMSDRELAEKLSAAGCEVSRRTVAKYRGLLCIPDASARKRG